MLLATPPGWTFLFCDWSPFKDFLQVSIVLVRRLGCLEMGAWSPCPVGASEALGVRLEPLKERGVFCSVLTMALFSLCTTCPFVHIRGLGAGMRHPLPHPEVGCEAKGLDTSMCLHGSEMPRCCRLLLATPYIPRSCSLGTWAPSLRRPAQGGPWAGFITPVP